ncbi:hypothetical protein IW261DRAFT_498810 [Armillaria novae-zelandiae]|uniref:DUF6535 domain-containing protein n=1 Tax=Armillaria novae-zelandiae TaxID=153914 RepID=A0AA39P034_9AGAR|nr:hypothetical protein IW261DRAFT_498810 [Armillaria novae-zelandiae]
MALASRVIEVRRSPVQMLVYRQFNYEDKYPEDKIYEETAPNARVWRTYVDESTNYDTRMVGESRDSVDVLLVFAGLFSAVVTTFVAQTSQSLQADYAQVSATLLFEMVLIQRALANGSSLDNVPVSTLNPYTGFIPATTDVWVNGLWFTSLSLSLATALVAVLVKQWLHHYLALPSGTPRETSHVRQYRYGGFQRWHVLVIIGLLPVLMHLALGIFFVGLVIFLGTTSTWPFLGHRHRNCCCIRDVSDNHPPTNSIPTMPLPHTAVRSRVYSLSLYYTGPNPLNISVRFSWRRCLISTSLLQRA